jgi:hypothetical protein
MRKIIVSILVISLVAAGGYLLYRFLMPDLIAKAMVSESLPGYIPKRLQSKIEKIRKPLNKGTEAMLQTMHASNIPVDQLLNAVENITEEQAYAFLDELNETEPTTTDEVFDVAKKHFSTNFDLEVFREQFNKQFEIEQIQNAIAYANFNRKTNDVDIPTAKEIFKKIIVEKEKEIGKPVNQ